MAMAMPRPDINGDGQITIKVELLYAFTPLQKEVIWTALDTWERLTNVDFSTHPLDADVTMTFDSTSIGSLNSTWGFAYIWGDIVLDTNVINVISEDYLSKLVLHEVGHILGLEHQSRDSVMTPIITDVSAEPTAKDIANLEVFYGEATDDVVAVVQAGGSGDQEVVGNAGPDILYGNQGMDTLSARAGDDTLYGGQDDDRLAGGSGTDILYGNLASDILIGGDGNDTLFGGQDADTLSGGAGDDRLVGGLGGDLFVGGGGQDTIADFSSSDGDQIDDMIVSWSAADGDVTAWLADGASIILIGVSTD